MTQVLAKTWTRAQIEALGIRTDGVTACAVVYGCGRTLAYQLLKSGQVDFKVIRVPGTNRFVVPTSELLRLLELDGG